MIDDLSPESQDILNAGRHLDDPRPSDRARVRRALLAKVAAGGAAAVVTGSATAAAAVKVVVATVLVVGAGVGGTVWWRAQHAPAVQTQPPAASPRVAAPAPAPVIVEAVPPAEVPVETAPVVAPAAVRAPSAKPRAVAAPARNLTAETTLLAEANEALRDGDTRLGLQLLDEYDRRFPRGALRQEMTATRIIARCQLIPSARNREAARQFLTQFPASPLAARVRSSCASPTR